VKFASKAKKLSICEPSLPLTTTTFGPPPGPAAQITSGKPSPFTSPTATRTPPVKWLSKAKKLLRNVPSAARIFTSGPPPASAAVTNTLLGSGVHGLLPPAPLPLPPPPPPPPPVDEPP